MSKLTGEQRMELKLRGLFPDAFPSEEARHTAWEAHPDLHCGAHPGHRFEAWWEYSSPEPRDHSRNETIQLIDMGELTDEEFDEYGLSWLA